MSLPLIVVLSLAAAVLVWRMAYLVDWRSGVGRHALGHVETVSRDDEEPITEILPVIRDYTPYQQTYDPSFYRLSRAVQRWTEQTGTR